jgi:hypothetical protein
MKISIFRIGIAIIIIVAGIQVFKAQTPQDERISEKQVLVAKDNFAKMLNEDNVKSFGLESVDQLKSLQTGQQFKRNMITLEDLRKFKKEDDPKNIIKSLDVIDVMLVDGAGNIVTSIEFTRGKENMSPSGFGLTPGYIALKNTIGTINPELKSKELKFVEIPSLNVSFLAVYSGATLNFICLDNLEALGLKRGTVISASEALTKLVPVANEYNGLPM